MHNVERRPAAIETVGTDHHRFCAELVRHLPALHTRAAMLERDLAPDDLVQDTVERALRSWRRFQPGTNVRAWLLTIMQNLFVDRYRVRSRAWSFWPAHLDPDADADAENAPTAPWQRVTLDDVKQVAAQLHPALRQTFELVCLKGLSYDQAAEKLGVPRPTIGTRLLRARVQLRSLLLTSRIQADEVPPGAPRVRRLSSLSTDPAVPDPGICR